jgi:hypothetical protein
MHEAVQRREVYATALDGGERWAVSGELHAPGNPFFSYII